METHERVRHLRKDHLKLSQKNFGERLGVSRSVINNIERNVLARPEQKDPLYKLICWEFNVNEDWLRTGAGEMFIKTDTDSEIMKLLGGVFAENDEFVKTLVTFMLRRSKEEWQPVKKMILELAEIVKNEKE